MGRLTGRIRRRGDRWQVIVVVGHDEQGYERRKYFSCRTEDEAKRIHARVMSELYAGTYTEPTRQTVSDFAAQWLQDYAAVNLRPTTYNNYEVSLRRHALPVIGGLFLSNVRPPDIQKVIAACQRKGLAPKTIKHVHTALYRLMSQATAWGLIGRNPAEKVPAPRVPKSEPLVWNTEEAQRFLAAVAEHRLAALFYLALATGMRRGELLGLQWSDVDFQQGVLRIRRSDVPEKGAMRLREPKTAAGVRTIALSPETISVLTQHRERVAAEGLGDCRMVFPSEAGTVLGTSTVRVVMARYIQRAGVSKIPLHSLRHTHATWLLLAGVHPKVVAERLGHSDVGVTMNVYSHLMPDLQREAAAAIDTQLGADWVQLRKK